MKIQISTENAAWIDAALSTGAASSADEAVNAPLDFLRSPPTASAEDFLGMTTDQLRAEYKKGLDSGPAVPWEGVVAFGERMRQKRGGCCLLSFGGTALGLT